VERVALADTVYARLLALRSGLRHFERWSEQQAREAGLTPAQHQLLLAIRGHGDPRGPTIGEVADYLLLRHHSAVGLVDRADAAGLVSRTRDEEDRRVVRLHLTDDGAERIEALSALHLEELERLSPPLPAAWVGLAPVQRTHGFPETALAGAATAGRRAKVGIARVYDDIGKDPTPRVLVDRLWPRGLARSAAPFEKWAQEVAPSPELRKWYGHAPQRFADFSLRYRDELTRTPSREALQELRQQASAIDTVLLTASKDLEHSGAAVLRDVLTGD
jgi:uncharacterized protein YeaO (DUF488 family)/DNA-binding MarR family transcriptional regulator